MFFWDPTMILMIPGLILTLWAQAKVKSAFDKYSRVGSYSGLTGAEVARRILNANGLAGVGIERIKGQLTDHYDPRDGILRLSEPVYGSWSWSSGQVPTRVSEGRGAKTWYCQGRKSR